MELNFPERIALLKILPREGNYTTLRIIRTLEETLSVDDEEYKEFEIEKDGDKVKFGEKAKVPKEIEIGEIATQIIRESLEKLDKEKKLRNEFITVYEKFVKGGSE